MKESHCTKPGNIPDLFFTGSFKSALCTVLYFLDPPSRQTKEDRNKGIATHNAESDSVLCQTHASRSFVEPSAILNRWHCCDVDYLICVEVLNINSNTIWLEGFDCECVVAVSEGPSISSTLLYLTTIHTADPAIKNPCTLFSNGLNSEEKHSRVCQGKEGPIWCSNR